MERRPPGKLETLLALASTLVMAWYMLPEADRTQIQMRVVHVLHRASARLARAEGYRGMSDELNGRENYRYRVAYRISLVRDAFGKAMERLKA